MCPILIVGAGFSGSVIARLLAESGYQVTVIDKRNHIGGNCFDFINDHGVRIHKYGPHLFHTNNLKVVDWLSQFTDWLPYKHKVKAMLSDGSFVTLPANRSTKEIVGAENIIPLFYKPYSKKMWGMDMELLDPDVFNRVPIRDDDNEFYFPNDTFQAVPAYGYTFVFEQILKHENIKILLNTAFDKKMEADFYHVFNSMSIDEYYGFIYGALPYRSIKFHTLDLPFPKVFDVATINFTHDSPYTRVTEWKNIPGHGVNNKLTTISYEEPCDYSENNFERYYPVKDFLGENKSLYEKYTFIPNNKVTFIGRCGQYLYLDMHQVISSSMSIAQQFIQRCSLL
jgi:UDP-galactopyranose mutase